MARQSNSAPYARLAAALLVCLVSAAGAAPAPDDRTITSGRLTLTVHATGLPEQIVIAPEREDLPLDLRAADAAPSPEQLQAIGRGPQLRGPVRIEAIVKGQTYTAEAHDPFAVTDGVPTLIAANLQAGPLALALRAEYDLRSITVTLTPRGKQDVDGLRLVLPLAGPVDTVIPLSAAGMETPWQAPVGAFTPATHEGVVWNNTKGNGSESVLPVPGVPTFLFAGTGDRGFCVGVGNPGDWPTDPAQPSVELVRDKAGQFELHIWIANRAATLADKTPFVCTLHVLPGFGTSGKRSTELAAWQRADVASESSAGLLKTTPTGVFCIRVEGAAGGDAFSAEKTLADSCPIELFRYLAGCPAAAPAQLRTNAATLVKPGMSPAVDRMAVGRALLHGIGVDGRGIAHRVLLLRAVAALERFGLFRDGGAGIEFLPYWRSAEIVRYGERFESAGAFATDKTDPVGRVYVSAYVRPVAGGKGERETLFIVVNESDKPLREQFYILKPAYVFGGANRATAMAQIAGWDLSAIPKDSDWAREKLIDSAVRASRSQDAGRPASTAELYDCEDDGFVDQASAKDGIEVYGPLFIPARGYRILYGSGVTQRR